jgi:esterase/lipase superfamily enzyme
MVKVYFATNRKPDATKPNGFGADIVAEDPAAISYAVADVEATDIARGKVGHIAGISDLAQGAFSPSVFTEITAGKKNLLVFIHGFDNSFTDAILRAGYNAEWFRASGEAAADTTVLAFTWPSLGLLFAQPKDITPDAYFADQAMAGKSGFHLGHFFTEVARIRTAWLANNPRGRVFLLAHSMGNWALQAAMSWWFQAHGPDADMFDEIILAAADEVYTTFETPDGSRLVHLRDIGKRINIYYSMNDAILAVSHLVNENQRLGQTGPENKFNTGTYPTDTYRMMDCTAVNDFWPPLFSEETHQYYRLSRKVRTDIAAVMANRAVPAGGIGALSVAPSHNSRQIA